MSSQASPEQPDTAPETNLISFIVRFVCDADGTRVLGGPAAGWHGLIRHVQSDAERYFTHWDDAMAFIGQFVDVASSHGPPLDDATA